MGIVMSNVSRVMRLWFNVETIAVISRAARLPALPSTLKTSLLSHSWIAIGFGGGGWRGMAFGLWAVMWSQFLGTGAGRLCRWRGSRWCRGHTG